jgi:hypothetical protein
LIARLLTPDKRTTIEVEADSIVGLFEAISEVQGVFFGLTCACDSVNVRLDVRPGKTNDGRPFKNYEARCCDCGKLMRFGLREDGGMWAKNKPADGGTRGWMTWSELTGGCGDSQRRDEHDQRTPESEDDRPETPW